jgi:(4-(4-[2-(gamma-L-glutamylamino)ethyl]phenoxymethyl)furan-2-yl)methanamine synthase
MATSGSARRWPRMLNTSGSWTLVSATSQPVLGLDIGGANIKAATSDGRSVSVPFAMWLRPQDLAQQLVELAGGLPSCRSWAVTMTGEMADVFYDRAVGIATLVKQTLQAAEQLGIADVAFYSVAGSFVDSAVAIANPDAVASANWHALATWAAGMVDSPSLLIDIGGTTTDIIRSSPDGSSRLRKVILIDWPAANWFISAAGARRSARLSTV